MLTLTKLVTITKKEQKDSHHQLLLKKSPSQKKQKGLVVVTPPLPQDGGTACTVIQVHAVNLIEIKLGERWQPISNQS